MNQMMQEMDIASSTGREFSERKASGALAFWIWKDSTKLYNYDDDGSNGRIKINLGPGWQCHTRPQR
jgi:hypothetical protein